MSGLGGQLVEFGAEVFVFALQLVDEAGLLSDDADGGFGVEPTGRRLLESADRSRNAHNPGGRPASRKILVGDSPARYRMTHTRLNVSA